MAEEKTKVEEKKKLVNVDKPLVDKTAATTATTSATGDQAERVDKEKPTTSKSLAENIKTERDNAPFNDREGRDDEDEIFNRVDVSELYFRAAEPYDLPPLSKYFLCEWSEAEHLFRPAMEFAEEVYGEWSPCPSPSRTSVGL